MPENDKLYSIWTSMKSRCANKNDKDYAYYGGRGVSVCKRWQNSFDDFKKDMGARKSGETLERINNDGNYEPSNCKWATRADQSKNRNFAETHEFDAEIFSAGTWNGDKYTLDDLQIMVQNFNTLADAIKPPVKLGHEKSKINDGAPALGWVKSLKVAGSKLIATLTDVPSVVYQAIRKGLYKRISSEIYWDLKYSGKTFKRVLSAVALLGADIPAVKDLEDLQAFLTQEFQKESFGDLKAYSFEADTKADVISIKNHTDKIGGDLMSEEKLILLSDKLEALTEVVSTLKDENKTLKQAKEDAEKKYTDLKSDVSKKEMDAQIESLKAFCEDQVKGGKMTPAQRDIITGGDTLRVYQEGNALFITFDQFQKFAELMSKQLETDEKGNHVEPDETTDSVVQFTDKVSEYVAKHDVSYEVAYTKCLKLYPKLADAYAKGGD